MINMATEINETRLKLMYSPADYCVVGSATITGLERHVRACMREGYEPLGGVASSGNFYQAMLKPISRQRAPAKEDR
jgi:hypothetical protein